MGMSATSIPNYGTGLTAGSNAEAFEENQNLIGFIVYSFRSKKGFFLLTNFEKLYKNRYYLVGAIWSYTDYVKSKGFHYLTGIYGMIIIQQETVREHPIGKIAERTIVTKRKPQAAMMEKGLNGFTENI
jgi:cell division protein FtsI (penicillin-binding protein 3)